jgi:hypothetical protein
MPIDLRARERLRTAQRSESVAVGAAFRARRRQDVLQSRLRDMVAKHEVAIADATRQVQEAWAQVVNVSGFGRAALLLNVSVQELKAACAATRSDPDQS